MAKWAHIFNTHKRCPIYCPHGWDMGVFIVSILRKIDHVLIASHCIWVRSLRCGCLVTWFCYHSIAKPGNKKAAPSWPDPYIVGEIVSNRNRFNNEKYCYIQKWRNNDTLYKCIHGNAWLQSNWSQYIISISHEIYTKFHALFSYDLDLDLDNDLFTINTIRYISMACNKEYFMAYGERIPQAILSYKLIRLWLSVIGQVITI